MMVTINDLLDQFRGKKSLFDQFTNSLETLLIDLISDEGTEYHTIASRTKEAGSLYTKLKKGKKNYRHIEEITDIVGLRIITYFSSDIDKLAKLIEEEFTIDEANSVDKRKQVEADQFGYMSLHYIISLSPERLKLREYKKFAGLKAEIQIRTILQHTWAQIEHSLGYKSEKQVPYSVRRSFSRVSSLLETADNEFDQIRDRMAESEKELLEEIEQQADRMTINEEVLALYLKYEAAEFSGGYNAYFGIPNRELEAKDYERYCQMLHYLKLEKLGDMQRILADEINEADEDNHKKGQILAFKRLSKKEFPHYIDLLGLFLVSQEKSQRYIKNFLETFPYKDIARKDIMELFTIIDVIESGKKE